MLSWMVAEAKGPLLEARQSWKRSDFQCSYKEPLVVPQQRTGVEWGRLRGLEGSAPPPAACSAVLGTGHSKISVWLFDLLITNHPRPQTGGGGFFFFSASTLPSGPRPVFVEKKRQCILNRRGQIRGFWCTPHLGVCANHGFPGGLVLV